MLNDSSPPKPRNALVEMLPRPARKRLLDACDEVTLALGDAICAEDKPLKHVYFPLDCIISQLSPGPGGRAVEVALVGAEGMLGYFLLLGVPQSLYNGTSQVDGRALRMTAKEFLAQAKRTEELRRLCGLYGGYQALMMARMVYCHRFHDLEPRLARWLLMMAERTGKRVYNSTHEFLAIMLGTRRPGVTIALAELNGRGLVRYQRGQVEIVDLKGLMQVACDCYAYTLDSYTRYFRP